jgi:hypothetical protein
MPRHGMAWHVFFFPFFPGAVDAHNYGEKLVACEQALVEPMTS